MSCVPIEVGAASITLQKLDDNCQPVGETIKLGEQLGGVTITTNLSTIDGKFDSTGETVVQSYYNGMSIEITTRAAETATLEILNLQIPGSEIIDGETTSQMKVTIPLAGTPLPAYKMVIHPLAMKEETSGDFTFHKVSIKSIPAINFANEQRVYETTWTAMPIKDSATGVYEYFDKGNAQ